MNLPIPYTLFINTFVRKSVIKKLVLQSAGKYSSQHPFIQSLVENMDYGELRASLHQLAMFPGHVFVDVQTADGTVVKITNH